MKHTPRDYQDRGFRLIREQRQLGHRKIVAVASTGAGKTTVAAMIIEACVAKGRRAMFLAHRKELIDQSSKALAFNGIPHGRIQGSKSYDVDNPVVVASIMTLMAKKDCPTCKKLVEPKEGCEICKGAGRYRARPRPDVEVIVLDECHRACGDDDSLYNELLDEYPDATIIGLTATPWRLDGRGLGSMFTSIVIIAEMQELIDAKHLLPLDIHVPNVPDLEGVSIVSRTGDYDKQELDDKIKSDTQRVGRIVENWQRLGEDRKTVVFAASIRDSLEIMQKFNDAGIPAGHVDGKMKVEDREAAFADLSSGKIKILCNVDVCTEGWDMPELGCVVLARPTKSLTRYLQSVGRVMRPFEGMEYGIVLDHAGCVREHLEPELRRNWSLEDRRKAAEGEADPVPLVVCEQCGTVRSAARSKCRKCHGSQMTLLRGIPVEVEADLVPYDKVAKYQCSYCSSQLLRLRQISKFEYQARCRDCDKTSYVTNRRAVQVATIAEKREEYNRLRLVATRNRFGDAFVEKRYFAIFRESPKALSESQQWFLERS